MPVKTKMPPPMVKPIAINATSGRPSTRFNPLTAMISLLIAYTK
jgi:hypothetical protein